jgi:hypothetical protein
VKILRSSDDDIDPDLAALSPISGGADLLLAEGLQLGRNIWHRFAPPVSSAYNPDSTVWIEAREGFDDSGSIFAESDREPGVVHLKLDAAKLPKSGNVFLSACSKGGVVASTNFLARSARLPRPLDRQGRGLLGYRSIGSGQPQSELRSGQETVTGNISTFEPCRQSDPQLLASYAGTSDSGDPEYLSAQEYVADKSILEGEKRGACRSRWSRLILIGLSGLP